MSVLTSYVATNAHRRCGSPSFALRQCRPPRLAPAGWHFASAQGPCRTRPHSRAASLETRNRAPGISALSTTARRCDESRLPIATRHGLSFAAATDVPCWRRHGAQATHIRRSPFTYALLFFGCLLPTSVCGPETSSILMSSSCDGRILFAYVQFALKRGSRW